MLGGKLHHSMSELRRRKYGGKFEFGEGGWRSRGDLRRLEGVGGGSTYGKAVDQDVEEQRVRLAVRSREEGRRRGTELRPDVDCGKSEKQDRAVESGIDEEKRRRRLNRETKMRGDPTQGSPRQRPT